MAESSLLRRTPPRLARQTPGCTRASKAVTIAVRTIAEDAATVEPEHLHGRGDQTQERKVTGKGTGGGG
jgi:hypothetical protein